MKISIVGNQVCITSAYTNHELNKVKRNRPDALKLYEGSGQERHPVFSISTDTTGGMNNSFLCFREGDTDINGKAIVMFPVPSVQDTPEKTKAAVAEYIGARALYAKKIEQQIDAAITAINNEQNSVMNMIEA